MTTSWRGRMTADDSGQRCKMVMLISFMYIILYIYNYIYITTKNTFLLVFLASMHIRMLDFTFPLQLKGTCLPQKNCFSLDLVYYMVGIA